MPCADCPPRSLSPVNLPMIFGQKWTEVHCLILLQTNGIHTSLTFIESDYFSRQNTLRIPRWKKCHYFFCSIHYFSLHRHTPFFPGQSSLASTLALAFSNTTTNNVQPYSSIQHHTPTNHYQKKKNCSSTLILAEKLKEEPFTTGTPKKRKASDC